MRLAETHVPLRAPLLLLGLWALLGPVQGFPERPSWRYLSAEVVIPRRHTHYGKGLQVPGWLSYSLRFGGRRHIVHLRSKTQFQPRRLPVVTQNDQGALQMDYPFIPLDCNYIGYVEEVPYSMATIDTCYGGLEGIMKLDDLAYEIKPLKDSLIFEHIVSQIVVDVNNTEPRYTPEEERPSLFDGTNVTADPRIPRSVIAAQQLSRAFGLYYDDPYCHCQRRATCLMFRYPVLTDAYSNCSYVHLAHIVTGVTLWCLYFKDYTYFNRTHTEYFCGNRLVEDGEQCDCGSFKQCYANTCCHTTCKFTAGSICDGQDCCTNCTYSPAGTLCRPIKNICDLPEYCTGSMLTCPTDLYMQDGTPCTEEGYCYLGNCSDRSMHCREIFGRNSVKGDEVCYKINAKGNRFGHCSRAFSALRHRACAPADLLCGRLQCGNVTHLPRLQEHVSFHQSKYGNSWCFGLDEHRETQTLDVGYVRNGTRCAPGKYCINSLCNGSLPAIRYDCTPEKCNFRGLCNNKRQCHCHVGWDPPLCKKRGAGGSEGSGPPPRKQRTVTQSEEPVYFLRIVFGRIYAFIAALLFGVATNVRTIKTAAGLQDCQALGKDQTSESCGGDLGRGAAGPRRRNERCAYPTAESTEAARFAASEGRWEEEVAGGRVAGALREPPPRGVGGPAVQRRELENQSPRIQEGGLRLPCALTGQLPSPPKTSMRR
ncbi:disintegrin and metalloproteinase domain-containing protein 21-like [Erethizon dorsatum]